MQFWQDTITEKSFKTLQELKGLFEFVLIGGWAVYLYTQKMKSKDIDIIIDYDVLGQLKEKYQVIKNDRLKKYEINMGEFDIDIYLSHYSDIGFPLEKLAGQMQGVSGFIVPRIEILLTLKLYAYRDRKDSLKGEKDKIDIISLLDSVDIDWVSFRKLDGQNDSCLVEEIKEVLSSVSYVKELGLNNQGMAKLRQKVLSKIKK